MQDKRKGLTFQISRKQNPLEQSEKTQNDNFEKKERGRHLH